MATQLTNDLFCIKHSSDVNEQNSIAELAIIASNANDRKIDCIPSSRIDRSMCQLIGHMVKIGNNPSENSM